MLSSLSIINILGLIHIFFGFIKELLQPVLYCLGPNQSFGMARIAPENGYHFTMSQTAGVLRKSEGFLFAVRGFDCNFIAFHLTDGTESTHAFWLRSGALWRGIILPREFADAVVQALAGGG